MLYNVYMIYEYDNSTQFLKASLQDKAKQNPSYSMRAFAKKLGLSSGGLSLILNRKKKLSVARAYEIAVALELNSEEADYFVTLVMHESANSEQAKIQCLEKLKSINPILKHSTDLRQSFLDLEHFKFISEWYGLAILELISGVEGIWNAPTIARRLNISKTDTEVMLERLEQLEMIEKRGFNYHRLTDSLFINSALPNEGLKSYYEGIHDKSKESVRLQSPKEKIIASQVFAFDPKQLEEAEKLTNDYLNKLEALSLKSEKKIEVYQAITNIFRLTNKGENL